MLGTYGYGQDLNIEIENNSQIFGLDNEGHCTNDIVRISV